ncbi:MAG: hypothetical protein GXP55_01885 [Deltaproteobacteria bacterium]|nr:hypothetical protein [Deltaproteobacteria bacterium]
MVAIKATVENGRLVLDEPTSLPEGTVVELVPNEGWDALEPADRRLLHEALDASEQDVETGRVRSADALVAELRASAK